MSGKTPFLTTQWRHLLMMNYEIDPALLQDHIPPGTELDFHRGTTYVSIVGFLFLKTKLLGIPVPFHQQFEEVNLRFYVRRLTDGGWRRSVCFLREIAPKFAVSLVARTVYEERYITLPMKHRIEPGRIEYGWKKRGMWNTIRAKTCGSPTPPQSRSLEEFIVEHYWGYTLTQDGGCIEYQVAHTPWQAWQVTDAELNCDVKTIYGDRFLEPLSHPPVSSFVADGSYVTVFKGTRLQGV